MKCFYVLLLAVLLTGLARPALGQDAKAVDRGKAVFSEQKCSSAMPLRERNLKAPSMTSAAS